MSVAIVGSRDFNDYNKMCHVMRNMHGLERVVSGGADGADKLAARWAYEHKITIHEIIPDYQKYGRGAPLIRNKTIVKQSDWVVAFWDGKSPGTLNTLKHARQLRKPITIIIYNN